jgi:hypothetical protein
MRRIAVGAAAAAVLCLLAVAGAWWLAGRELRNEIAGWAERQRANGILFTHSEIGIGGFPFRLELTIPEPALAAADGARRWDGPAISASAPLWRPRLLRFEAPGRHRYRFTGSDGLAHEILLDMPMAAGQAAIEEKRIRTLDLDASNVRITGTAPGEVVVGGLEARLRLDPERAGDLKSDSGSVALAARSISFAEAQAEAAAADPIQLLELQLALTGPLPWEGGEDGLARWRQAGGTLELRRLALLWSALSMEGDGTLALDERMRPEGAFTFRLDGLEPMLQKHTAEGALTPEDAQLIARMAGNLGTADAAVPGRLLIAVTAQDGRLSIRDRTYRLLHPITAP